MKVSTICILIFFYFSTHVIFVSESGKPGASPSMDKGKKGPNPNGTMGFSTCGVIAKTVSKLASLLPEPMSYQLCIIIGTIIYKVGKRTVANMAEQTAVQNILAELNKVIPINESLIEAEDLAQSIEAGIKKDLPDLDKPKVLMCKGVAKVITSVGKDFPVNESSPLCLKIQSKVESAINKGKEMLSKLCPKGDKSAKKSGQTSPVNQRKAAEKETCLVILSKEPKFQKHVPDCGTFPEKMQKMITKIKSMRERLNSPECQGKKRKGR